MKELKELNAMEVLECVMKGEEVCQIDLGLRDGTVTNYKCENIDELLDSMNIFDEEEPMD